MTTPRPLLLLLSLVFAALLHVLLCASVCRSQDLTLPRWSLCSTGTPPEPAACFTVQQTQQLLRIQAAAAHSLELQRLYDELVARHREFEAAQLAVQERLEGLLEISRQSNAQITRELAVSENARERLRRRVDRRRWVPWVTLSVGAVVGSLTAWGASR